MYNTLVSTCVGEEGLDIGEVDLVVCFDNGFSPIRLVQRMGRTGRKREGRVYVMLMEGKEFFMFRAMLKRSKGIRDNLKMQSINGAKDQTTLDVTVKKKQTNYRLYKVSPRMLPADLEPSLKYLELPVQEEEQQQPPEKMEEEETEAMSKSTTLGLWREGDGLDFSNDDQSMPVESNGDDDIVALLRGVEQGTNPEATKDVSFNPFFKRYSGGVKRKTPHISEEMVPRQHLLKKIKEN